METPCIIWWGRIDPDGYGRVPGGYSAHRVVYESSVGPIPEGHEIDHLCNNRACVNPLHLEPVTHEENTRRAKERRGYCQWGHELTADNTYVTPKGYRNCRECIRWSQRKYRKHKKEQRRLA